jgi:hypothetical protein
MKNKVLGWLLIIPMLIAILAGLFQPVNEEDIYTISGLMMFVFGTWAGIRLINLKD